MECNAHVIFLRPDMRPLPEAWKGCLKIAYLCQGREVTTFHAQRLTQFLKQIQIKITVCTFNMTSPQSHCYIFKLQVWTG